MSYFGNADINGHIADETNPHSTTATHVGLGNVDNTSDADKPVSTAQQTALDGKSDVGHAHTESDITDLDKYTQAEVDALISALTPITATVQTTDATPTQLVAITIPADEEKIIELKVRGHEDATDDSFWKKIVMGVKNVSGTVSTVGGSDIALGYDDPGATNWVAATSVSTNTVVITVTGEAAKTINWKVTYEVD